MVKRGDVTDLNEIVGMMPLTLMLKIFFGSKFINDNQKKISNLSTDAHFIMTTVFHDKKASTGFYRYFDTTPNR